MPAVSVIMPVFNSNNFLRAAIDSILSQTLQDFEFLILNDGSTDNSKEIVLSYTDKRIQFFDSDVNCGYTERLNHGLSIAKGKYIARMDSDDIALPDRLQVQYDFMEAHGDVVLCGGHFDFIENKADTQRFNWVTHTDNDLLRINLLFDCAICHPTVMMRNETLQSHFIRYDPGYEPSEDFELWVRLSQMFKIANLKNKLLLYRVSENQVSGKNNEKQRANKFLIINRQLTQLGISPTNVDLRIHDQMFYGFATLSYDYLPKLQAWTQLLLTQNEIHCVYNQKKLEGYLSQLYKINLLSFKQQLSKATLKMKAVYLLKKTMKWNSIR